MSQNEPSPITTYGYFDDPNMSHGSVFIAFPTDMGILASTGNPHVLVEIWSVIHVSPITIDDGFIYK